MFFSLPQCYGKRLKALSKEFYTIGFVRRKGWANRSMDEALYEVSFQIILHAGNSKSKSMLSMKAAREKDYEKAQHLIDEAIQELHQAHLVQTEMIQNEAAGEKTEMNLILVHAQDHIGMATVLSDVAQELLYVYQNTQRVD